MITKIPRTYSLSATQNATLQALIPFQPGVWDKSSLQEIKDDIHNQLLTIQNSKCCYCGLNVNETGRAEIDHIAFKGGKKVAGYPEFTFTPENLAIACQFCNSSSKKWYKDVLSFVDRTNYANCRFLIVHPYFDNPDLHYKWSKGKFKILISSSSIAGRYSIGLFKLDSEAHTSARAKQIMFEGMKKKYERNPKFYDFMEKIKEVLNFKR